jgi:hypothetical protein
MTLLNELTYYTSGSTVLATLSVFGLMNPPTGAQTISATQTNVAAPPDYQALQTVSYNGVLSFGPVVAKGWTFVTTPAVISDPIVPNQIVVNALAGYATTFTGYSQNQRSNLPDLGASLAMVVGDAIGVTLVNGVVGGARGRGSLAAVTQVGASAPKVSGALNGRGSLSAVTSMPLTFSGSNTNAVWGAASLPLNVLTGASATQFSLSAFLSGRGVLTASATTVVYSPRFAEVGYAAGRGVLSAAAKSVQFRETDFLSGNGLLAAQATTIYKPSSPSTAFELGAGTGHGCCQLPLRLGNSTFLLRRCRVGVFSMVM